MGVTFDRDLKFTDHINIIVQKANNVLGIIKRTFTYRDANSIRLLYTTLVRPILDYCSTVWYHLLLKNIRKLDLVQRRSTKIIPSLYDLSYTERLQRLNLQSLLYHRIRMDLIMTYKIINGLVDVDMNYFFTVNANGNHTRSNGLKLYKSRLNSNTRKFSFSQRIINDWNSLPLMYLFLKQN